MAAYKFLKTVHEPQLPEETRYLEGLLEKEVLYTLRSRGPNVNEVWQRLDMKPPKHSP